MTISTDFMNKIKRMVHDGHCNQGEYEGSCKYGDEDCPAMNTHPAPELVEFLDKGIAARYHEQGYICISNKYRRIGRPDRKDWHIALAEQLRCAPADFIKRDGSGELCERWREHYIRGHTSDKLEVSEQVYNYLKRMM